MRALHYPGRGAVRRSYAAFIILALACFASGAGAQFTAAVVPPKQQPRVDTAARADSVRKARAELTERVSDMKAWVDSAATALAMTPTPPAESTAAPAERRHTSETAAGEVRRPPRKETTTFREGAPAPATATMLPLLTIVGAGALLAGIALIRR
jgi:hypothetical protein